MIDLSCIEKTLFSNNHIDIKRKNKEEKEAFYDNASAFIEKQKQIVNS